MPAVEATINPHPGPKVIRNAGQNTPTALPGNATIVLVNPTTTPVNPTIVPGNATIVLVNPTTTPVNPTIVPVNPTTVPVNPTTVPVNPTTVPANPTTIPANPTTIPATIQEWSVKIGMSGRLKSESLVG